jgi:signal-transduction protein with cAMP-binding, CBS, and nucleotidyltransferase domain
MTSAPREVWGDLATTAFVESSHLFKSLDETARADLLKLARLVAFAPGETISPEGDDGFYLVVEGSASVRAGGTDVATVERGVFFEASRVLAGSARAWSLVARSEATAVLFPAPVIAALAERFPRMKKLLEAVAAAREKEAAAKLGG